MRSKTCSDCRPNDRQNSPNWKGGRTYHKAGYVMVRAPQHERAGTGGYVFEHILVMELMGRSLYSEETVHHRNGVKYDNKPANLELWIRPQPSGIRVSDALARARTIIARYETMELQERSGIPNALGGAGGRTRVR